jgi:hypothetical protein
VDTSPSVIEISFCRPGENDALVAFIADNWRSDHVFVRDEDFLRWHYDPTRVSEVPEGGLSILLARDAGAIVGMLALNEVGFNLFGRRLPGVWTSLWFAAPTHRKQAVGARLFAKLMASGYGAIGMIGMNPAVRPFFRSLGYEMEIDTPRWCGVLDPDAAEKLLSENESAERSTVSSVARSLALPEDLDQRADPAGAFDIVEWDDGTAAAWEEAWKTRFAPNLVGSDRPAEYVSWRFVRHPIYRYRVRLAFDRVARRIDGLIVARIETPQGLDARALRIVDLIGSEPAMRALAGAEASAARTDAVAFADFHASGLRGAAPLEALGFQRIDGEGRGPLVPQRFQPVQFGDRPLTSAFRLSPDVSGTVGRLLERPDFVVSRADGDQDRPS